MHSAKKSFQPLQIAAQQNQQQLTLSPKIQLLMKPSLVLLIVPTSQNIKDNKNKERRGVADRQREPSPLPPPEASLSFNALIVSQEQAAVKKKRLQHLSD